MNQKANNLAVLYFTIFAFLLLLSAVALFVQKIGWTPLDVLTYYRGDETRFIMSKSFDGVLELLLPHFLAMGLFIMVMAHFLIFGSKKLQKQLKHTIVWLFLAAFLDIISPFLIIEGIEIFALIKLGAFILLQLLSIYLLGLLFFSSLQGSRL